ncbi:MAG: formylmethanofuran dehydrogenase subunit B [Archaeoglobaceae archaeon]|nr:formylmethanofuran dehydrogenase subunit B [Archaeoglobaceae archaeon]MCX8152002.1 formylmethanofuran dehydrogenase subunit B [Archaeoglobaceae archaeon]MDW8013391.1 formylmethanofuran dehydrogenase subunit B [Archaeoglobaceae archaeon]
MICTGCSCLCDDVEIRDGKILNACYRGYKVYSKLSENRARALVDRREVSVDDAIEKAVEILGQAKNPALYGFDTTTVEAQEVAVKIAEKLNAFIDDNSSFCLGEVVEAILKKDVPSTTLEDVRDQAYVIFYWGANPYSSAPRHMSKFTYYPRGMKRLKGYEDRFLVVVDVRRSETAKLAKKNAIFIKVESDDELVESFNLALEGKAGKYAKEVGTVITELKRSDFNAMFVGLGLKYGVRNLDGFFEMIRKINRVAKLYLIPSAFHSNMRGFNEVLFEKTGSINKFSFKEQRSDKLFAFTELLKRDEIDAVLLLGTDPLSSIPFEISKKIMRIKTVVVDPKMSLTAKIAKVVVPSAFSGFESSGTMVRSDGVRKRLEPIEEKEVNDLWILKKISEGL